MPFPILAAIDAKDWPHFCAPSPESLMISTTCSSRVAAGLSGAVDLRFPPCFIPAPMPVV
jgi:hypothetical protein